MVNIFGEDLSERKLQQIIKGEEKTVNVAFALRENFNNLVYRQFSPQIIFFPETFKLYLNKNDRNDFKNAKKIRDFIAEIIIKRKELMLLKQG